MSCWPACSDWCNCINDKCQPTPVTINAIRLRTPDGRYLQASNGGGHFQLLVAANVPPFQWETFLFIPLSGYPFRSGDPVSLNVCNMNWASAGENIPSTTSNFYPFLVRVDQNIIPLPHGKKDDRLVTFEIGGPDTRIYVMGDPIPSRFPTNPAEWTFDIVKIAGGIAAAPGTPINDGDQVSLRINSNRGNTFYFRVTGNQLAQVFHLLQNAVPEKSINSAVVRASVERSRQSRT